MGAYLSFTDVEGHIRKVSIEDVEKALGLKETETVRLGMQKGQAEMHAGICPKEEEYMGIDIDADIAGDPMYLGNFELPCDTYPDRIAARLYAGHHAYETDEPIAIVTHDVTDRALMEERMARHADRPMRKLIYVEGRLADARQWTEGGEGCMPEHAEDEQHGEARSLSRRTYRKHG